MAGQALGFDENSADVGVFGFDFFFEGGDCGLDVFGGQAIDEVDAGVDQDVLRAEVHGQQFVDGLNAAIALNAFADALYEKHTKSSMPRSVAKIVKMNRPHHPSCFKTLFQFLRFFTLFLLLFLCFCWFSYISW